AHVVTGSGTAWDALLAALAEDQLVDAGTDTAAGGWGYGKAAFTNWRCLNVNGVDYAITGVSTAAHTTTITGDSLSGAQTAIWYPHRIAGSTTSARVFRDSGRATVAADGRESIGGARQRDRMHGHWHMMVIGTVGGAGYVAMDMAETSNDASIIKAPYTDGVNGTPRTGPTTNPRASIVWRYLWAVVLIG
ncbi:MAG: hypothetical protein IMZ69_02415, partial [Spirochaetes bacterium]|nr:hypothetical protein [Spirochaetota bacterium]